MVGLGAIGGRVANTAVALGMQVVGYDPGLTLDNAWQLSAAIQRARSLDEALRTADFVSLHVPLNSSTRSLIDADRLKAMKRRVVILNFAREGIVDEAAMLASLDAGHAHAYINDFPTPGTIRHPKCVTLPHLGASTSEAEDNCAIMVADEVRDFLEHGHVRHSTNFPEIVVPRQAAHRCVCVCTASDQANARVAEALAETGVSVAGLAGATRGDLSVVVVDTAGELPEAAHTRFGLLEGLLSLRVLPV